MLLRVHPTFANSHVTSVWTAVATTRWREGGAIAFKACPSQAQDSFLCLVRLRRRMFATPQVLFARHCSKNGMLPSATMMYGGILHHNWEALDGNSRVESFD